MSEFFTITLIITLAAISPGPDFAMVVKNALSQGRKSGIFTALGVSCSILIHASYCALGLALIISQSVLLFNAIKYMGAFYLIFIGLKSLFAKPKAAASDQAHEVANSLQTALQGFSQGLLCNLLNPKAIIFILAFFTLIMKPTTSLNMQIVFILEIALIHFLWFSSLACLITYQGFKQNLNEIQHYIIKAMGLLLIGFGAHIALIA